MVKAFLYGAKRHETFQRNKPMAATKTKLSPLSHRDVPMI
jgi:hypothetical protein